MTWTEDALELWHDDVAEFGNAAKYESWTFQYILNPVRSGFQMTMNAYSDQRDTVVDMLRSDAVANGLYTMIVGVNPATKRPIITVNDIEFTLLSLESDDPTQPSIRINAVRKQ